MPHNAWDRKDLDHQPASMPPPCHVMSCPYLARVSLTPMLAVSVHMSGPRRGQRLIEERVPASSQSTLSALCAAEDTMAHPTDPTPPPGVTTSHHPPCHARV